MKRLGKFLRLAHAERVLLVEAALLLGAIGLGLRLLPFGRLRELLDRLSRPRHGLRRQGRLSAARIAWAVERVRRVVPGARSCLVQALAAQALPARPGPEACARVGAAPPLAGSLHADARIDNRAELCSVLSAPSTVTDAELILQAYARWGERCPEHLLGDFAFALWDARRGFLFCARDHFGVKPFYYHHRPGRLFAFASEIKGLLVLSDVPRRLNETRVADYLVPLLEDKEITFYEGIVRLPPAHHMTVSRDGVRIEQYWALDPDREIRMKSDGEYAAAFREIFTEAVRCRLARPIPVGSMLSGGLDSSSIVFVAPKLLAEDGSRELHTFSAIFPHLPES